MERFAYLNDFSEADNYRSLWDAQDKNFEYNSDLSALRPSVEMVDESQIAYANALNSMSLNQGDLIREIYSQFSPSEAYINNASEFRKMTKPDLYAYYLAAKE